MTDQTDVDTILRIWLADGPTTMPDRVTAVVDARTRKQAQRPSWRVAWRQIAMNQYARLVVGAAAVFLVVAVGFAGFSLGSSGGGSATVPTAAPTPTSTPTSPPSAAPSPTAAPSQTPLAGPPGVSLEGALPAGWAVQAGDNYAGTTNVQMGFSTGPSDGWTVIELQPNRAVMAADCAQEPEAGVGTDSAAIVDALAARTGLRASGMKTVKVGGLTGRQLDLAVDPTVGKTCKEPDAGFVPTTGLFAGKDWLYNGLTGDEVSRLIVLDVPGDRNVVVMISAVDQASFDRHIADAMAIVSALKFDTGA